MVNMIVVKILEIEFETFEHKIKMESASQATTVQNYDVVAGPSGIKTENTGESTNDVTCVTGTQINSEAAPCFVTEDGTHICSETKNCSAVAMRNMVLSREAHKPQHEKKTLDAVTRSSCGNTIYDFYEFLKFAGKF